MPALLPAVAVAAVLLLAAPAHAASRDVWPPAAYAQAKALVASLTLEEKLQLVSGMNAPYNDCHFSRKECSYVGLVAGIPRVGLGPIYLEDGPQGVADTMTRVTQWPSIMTISQSWRPELMLAMGEAMGAEHVVKGSNVMLGPAVALVRVPFSGRNFEYISEDPFLNAAMTGPMVRGVQSNNISACVKHWIFNSQETDRSGMASHVAERVGRELYEAPYRAAVDAGVGSVMCSFNRVNDTWSCASDAGLNSWLKGDLGFDGFVVSDWGATHNTSEFALGGLDQEQEWVKNATFFGATLGAYVANGSVPLARLDDMATRVVLPMFALGYAAPSPPSANPNATANSTEHGTLAHDLSAASVVLLKNDAGALPLPAGRAGLRVAVIGDDDLTGGGGSGQVQRPFTVRAAAALAATLPLATVTYFQGNLSGAAAAAAAADVAVVLVSVYGSEGGDRANLSLGCPPMAGPASCRYWPDQDALIEAVAAANPNTTVVVRAPGAVLMPWLGGVRAVVNQLFGGQAANTVLAEVLAGIVNPAGKLTVSFPASVNDTWLSWPASNGPINPASYPGVDLGGGYLEVQYAEGLNVGCVPRRGREKGGRSCSCSSSCTAYRASLCIVPLPSTSSLSLHFAQVPVVRLTQHDATVPLWARHQLLDLFLQRPHRVGAAVCRRQRDRGLHSRPG